jgi:hypothetical protein
MTPWEITILTYFLLGMCLSTMADIGHKKLYGFPLPWIPMVIGVLLWPIILLFGRGGGDDGYA